MDINKTKEINVLDSERCKVGGAYAVYYKNEFAYLGILSEVYEQHVKFGVIEYDKLVWYIIKIESVLEGKYRIVELKE